MPEDMMRYDLLAQEALRGVVRAALKRVKRQGFPGGHHFYIAFNTNFPGVEISERLHKKYDQEMTIVLQHQFWDLGVTEHTFEVGLSFSGVPERLLVPFEAVTGFFDPSVQFGLKFELNDGTATAEDAAPTPAPSPLRAIRGAGSEPSESLPKVPAIGSNVPKILPAAKIDLKADAKAKDGAGNDETDGGEAKPDEAAERTDAPQEGASVVSLDAFRRRTPPKN